MGKVINSMIRNKIAQNFLLFGIIATIILLDQISKWYVFFHLLDNDIEYYKINFFISLVKVTNDGISFGMLQNMKYSNLLIGILTLSLTCFMFYLLYKEAKAVNKCAISLIIGGAIGNIIDRVNYGYVIDFIWFHVGWFSWPVFNIADSAVCIGVFWYFVMHLLLSSSKV